MRTIRRSSFLTVTAAIGLALLLSPPASANSSGSGGGWGGRDCSKYEKGSKDWKECMAQARKDLEDVYALGYWKAKTGDYNGAIELLRAEGDQKDPRVLTMLGYATRHLGRVDEAMGYYQKALAANPEMTSTRQYLGEAFLQAEQPDKAKLQLGEIAKRCGTACKDYQDLSAAIATYASTHGA
jgi:tetratricopeptide (TPR) repeat protein